VIKQPERETTKCQGVESSKYTSTSHIRLSGVVLGTLHNLQFQLIYAIHSRDSRVHSQDLSHANLIFRPLALFPETIDLLYHYVLTVPVSALITSKASDTLSRNLGDYVIASTMFELLVRPHTSMRQDT
jgi:hypothetical protein